MPQPISLENAEATVKSGSSRMRVRRSTIMHAPVMPTEYTVPWRHMFVSSTGGKADGSGDWQSSRTGPADHPDPIEPATAAAVAAAAVIAAAVAAVAVPLTSAHLLDTSLLPSYPPRSHGRRIQ